MRTRLANSTVVSISFPLRSQHKTHVTFDEGLLGVDQDATRFEDVEYDQMRFGDRVVPALLHSTSLPSAVWLTCVASCVE